MRNMGGNVLAKRREIQTIDRRRFAKQELARLGTKRGFGKRVSAIDSAIEQLATGKIEFEEAERIETEIKNVSTHVPSEVLDLLNEKFAAAKKTASRKS